MFYDSQWKHLVTLKQFSHAHERHSTQRNQSRMFSPSLKSAAHTQHSFDFEGSLRLVPDCSQRPFIFVERLFNESQNFNFTFIVFFSSLIFISWDPVAVCFFVWVALDAFCGLSNACLMDEDVEGNISDAELRFSGTRSEVSATVFVRSLCSTVSFWNEKLLLNSAGVTARVFRGNKHKTWRRLRWGPSSFPFHRSMISEDSQKSSERSSFHS